MIEKQNFKNIKIDLWNRSYAQNVKWDIALNQKESLHAIFQKSAERHAQKICLDFLGKTYSYEEVQNYIEAAAYGLQEMGIKKGDRIGLMLPNTPYYVVMYFAILSVGAIVVNFNPLYAERELLHQVEDSGVHYMVTMDLRILSDKVEKVLQESCLRHVILCSMLDILPFFKRSLFTLFKQSHLTKNKEADTNFSTFHHLVRNGGSPTNIKINPQKDIAVLQYTGGTTGVPKGAMLTHANLCVNVDQIKNWFGDFFNDEEIFVGILPFFHVFAMTGIMLLGTSIGAKILLVPKFDLNNLLKIFDSKKPTIFVGVPTIYTAINNHPKRSKYDLSSIKACLSGGAPLPLEVKEAFEAHTGCTLVEGYGLSETSPVLTISPFGGVYKTGSVGLPMPGTEVKILSLEDDNREMPIGEKGEISAKGPQIMNGYWKNKKETGKSFKDGFFKTGDIGYLDKEGYLYIVDRLKDLIIAGGFNIYPRNVEEAIYLHPLVAECLVVGVPDKYRGQTVKAYIVLKDEKTLSAKDLLAFLKDKISPIEMPKKIEFRESLPKTMIGKLSRKDLLKEEKEKLVKESS